jgi:hypothetical protein
MKNDFNYDEFLEKIRLIYTKRISVDV